MIVEEELVVFGECQRETAWMKIPNVGFHAEIFADIFHFYISVVVNIVSSRVD